jgi:hypothetical protein
LSTAIDVKAKIMGVAATARNRAISRWRCWIDSPMVLAATKGSASGSESSGGRIVGSD